MPVNEMLKQVQQDCKHQWDAETMLKQVQYDNSMTAICPRAAGLQLCTPQVSAANEEYRRKARTKAKLKNHRPQPQIKNKLTGVFYSGHIHIALKT